LYTKSLTLSLHDALPISQQDRAGPVPQPAGGETLAEAPVDPGWPTISDPSPEPEARETDAPETQAAETETPDPSDPTGSRLPDPDRKSTRLNSSHVSISY